MRGREPFVRDPTREREREREEQAGLLSPHSRRELVRHDTL
jgi:hypothetical protein